LTNTNTHQYNLLNQGWSAAPTWATSSNSFIGIEVGANAVFTDIPSGLSISVGQPVNINGGIAVNTAPNTVITYSYQIYGVVNSYSGHTLSVNVGSFTGPTFFGTILSEQWYIRQGASSNYTSTWFTDTGTYPSNADVWWNFKDNTNTFNPTATVNNITLSSPAPKGSIIFNTFNQQPSVITGLSGLGSAVTYFRPKTGAWYAGRVFYAGVDATINTNGPNANSFYTWTENIYFSQIVVDQTQFPLCYQTNDPTSETLFDLLPTDGGVIQIQGCGSIYKLFPIQNGMLVFAANGIWFITGSQGIGFSANDYTVTKISQVRAISSTSFVNVLGLPFFWNEEGIYQVAPTQGGSLTVEPLTVGTIQTFFNNIPTTSLKYVRGDYDPINYQIQWLFKSQPETDVTSRYQFDRILNYNTYNKAFFPYTVMGSPSLGGINYVSSPVEVMLLILRLNTLLKLLPVVLHSLKRLILTM